MRARIAISGSAGVGKSTLARRLAADLGWPYVPEGMREYLESGAPSLHDLGPRGVRDLVLRLWEERKEAEARAGDAFVADRASYDFGAFWLYYRFAERDEATERYFAETLDPARYDVVCLLPWNRIPLVADGVRSSDPWVQLHVQLLIEGMVRRNARRVVEVTAGSIEERVGAVRGALYG